MMLVPKSPSVVRAFVFAAACGLALGCGDDGSSDTGADASGTATSTGTGADTEAPATDSGPAPGTTGSSGAVDPDITTSDGGSDTMADSSSGGALPGLCGGFAVIGDLANVAARPDATVDTTCDPVAAGCGGDVVGTWEYAGLCGYEAYGNPIEGRCPGSTFGVNVISDVGTIVFDPDGTLTVGRNTQTEIVFVLDSQACFGATCADFEAALQLDDPEASCTETADGECSCVIPQEPEVVDAIGTYVVNGDQLEVASDAGSDEWTYCVEGERLTYWTPLYDLVETDEPCADEADCIAALGDEYLGYVCDVE